MKYYDGEAISVLRQNMKLSASTWHKIMHPLCAFHASRTKHSGSILEVNALDEGSK